MTQDPAQSTLKGDVEGPSSGGAIRYRVWPPGRHPIRTIALVLALLVGSSVVGWWSGNAFWGAVVLLGTAAVMRGFFFPIEVALDGGQLILRAFGSPQAYNLSEFRRLAAIDEWVPRVELIPRMDGPWAGVWLPLPHQKALREVVIGHLQRWVGRRMTGEFRLDDDLLPEENLDEEDAG